VAAAILICGVQLIDVDTAFSPFFPVVVYCQKLQVVFVVYDIKGDANLITFANRELVIHLICVLIVIGKPELLIVCSDDSALGFIQSLWRLALLSTGFQFACGAEVV